MRGNISAGFTLMEILVVVGLIALLAVLVIGGISEFASRQAFEGAVADVRDVVMTAREQTLGSTNDSLYGVHVGSGAITRFAGGAYTAGDSDNFIVTLPNSITATPSFSHGGPAATFTRLKGLPSATGTIVLTDTVNDLTATITLSASGLIQ